MIGQPYTVVMAPSGEVVKVEGLSKLAEKMFSNMPADPAACGRARRPEGQLERRMRCAACWGNRLRRRPIAPLKIGEVLDH